LTLLAAGGSAGSIIAAVPVVKRSYARLREKLPQSRDVLAQISPDAVIVIADEYLNPPA